MNLIIGLVGYSNSGKETLYRTVYEFFHIPRITSGDMVRREVKKRGLDLTPKNISLVSDLIRKENNNNFMIIAEEEISKLSKCHDVLIIDSLREEKDYSTLRQFSSNIKTIALVSESRIRYERMIGRKREGDPITWEEFLVLEQKGKLLGVENLIKSADYIVRNEDSLNKFRKQSIITMKELLDKHYLSI